MPKVGRHAPTVELGAWVSADRKPRGRRGSQHPASHADIAAAAAADAGGIDAELLGDYLAVVEAATAAGRRLTRRELDRFRAAGARAAQTSIELRDLVDLYLSATWRLWRRLPVVEEADTRERWLDIGEAVLRAADDSAAAVADGFAQARRAIVRREVAARRELFDDLLSGRGDVVRVVEQAAVLGLDLAGLHAVALVKASAALTDGDPVIGVVERLLADDARGLVRSLVATRNGDLVVVYAAPDATTTDRVVNALRKTFAGRRGSAPTARIAAVPALRRIGVGRARTGAAGVRASYEDAANAVVAAERLGREDLVVRADDLAVFDVLMADRAAISDLVATMLDPLLGARGGARPLLDTLDAFLATGGNASETARRLHLSVRAVTYRLARVAELTGHDPGEPNERFALQAAVFGARLLNWPAGSAPPSARRRRSRS